MKCNNSTGATAAGAVVAAKPGRETQPALELDNAESDWLCAWCHNNIARECDRFAFEGKDEFVFPNPEGIRFEIITFLDTFRCTESGVPTLQHTWFPGYAWSFCQCGDCGQHLGWYYTGPQQFVGLIKNRIVRALNLNN